MRALFLIICFLAFTFLKSQENEKQLRLLKEAQKNHISLNENPQKSFSLASILIEEARNSNAHAAELTTLMTYCKYYRRNTDYEKMMQFAEILEQKAKEYNLPVYEASALIYQAEIYHENSQQKKWKQTIEEALKVLEKSPLDSLTILTRSNIYVSLTNFHSDFESKLKYIKKSIDENKKIPDVERRNNELYMAYANLAVVYSDHNTDSAKYFALLSLSKSTSKSHGDFIFLDYLVLSNIALKESKYEDAIQYLKKAEQIKGYKNWSNIQLVYNNFIEAYKKLNDEKEVNNYKSKNDSLSILIVNNQNKFLLQELKENQKSDDSEVYIIVTIVLLILVILIFYIIRRKRQKKSDLNQAPEFTPKYDYSILLKNVKNKDKSFMIHFEEAYPSFSSKLLRISPKMSQGEIEFCALLKLKIPTKEIASYKNIEAKSVRNQKYRIKKKLNIPDDADIYQWFHDF